MKKENVISDLCNNAADLMAAQHQSSARLAKILPAGTRVAFYTGRKLILGTVEKYGDPATLTTWVYVRHVTSGKRHRFDSAKPEFHKLTII